MKKLIEKETFILELLSEIYISILILLFPLIVDSTAFFHILECKWHFYLVTACVYIISIIGTLFYFKIFKKSKFLKNIKFSIVQWLAIAFLIINIISCFFSPFFDKYNLFIGVGRGEGLIMMSLYSITFIFISLFSKFKKRYILYFSISSILVNFIAILQYIGFNPFNMYQNGIGTHNVSFMSTIGNIDFISAMFCILLSVSFSAFVFLEEKKVNKIIHLLSILMGSFIFGIINVQSGKVAFFATLILILPFIILKNERLSRFLIMVATVLFAYCINIVINPEYHYSLHSLNLYYQFNYIVLLFLIVIFILVYLSFVLKKVKFNFLLNKKILKYFYLGLFICAICGVLFIYFYNFKSGMLYEIHELLHGNFDDRFGTHRIFLWKRTLSIFPQYPIIGSGPDTFAIRFMAKYTADVAAIGPLTINDTAANVYLTMLINIGIVGLGTYLAFIFFQIKKGLKDINEYSVILLIPIVCYLFQDFFNLSLVIVTPIFWLLLALHYKSTCLKKREISLT
ncbi:MAG: O-antigen ligase family protein [Bacilli bacterium]